MILENLFGPIDEDSFKTTIVANHYNWLGPKTEQSKQNTTTKLKTKTKKPRVKNLIIEKKPYPVTNKDVSHHTCLRQHIHHRTSKEKEL